MCFSFFFVSLISPFITTDLNLFFPKTPNKKSKIMLKQSYVILTWFYYFKVFEATKKKKSLRFFVFPIRQQIYTLTRAPVAHKTWSREQYKFQFYLIRISLTDNKFSDEFTNNFNQTLLFILLLKWKLPLFETNLLLLKNILLKLDVLDSIYFNYFIQNNKRTKFKQ